jgi:anti-sigma B factor antagonist
MQGGFSVETHTIPRGTTVTVRGELDLLSSPLLERALGPVLDSDAEQVIVDLRGLEFMDSSGLHVLLRAHQLIHDAGRRLVLVRGSETVQRVFDLTGVSDTLTIVASPEEALEVGQAAGPS